MDEKRRKHENMPERMEASNLWAHEMAIMSNNQIGDNGLTEEESAAEAIPKDPEANPT